MTEAVTTSTGHSYPRSNQITFATKLAHLPKIGQGLAELTDIMVHVQELLYDDKLLISFRTLFSQVEIPYNRLQLWLEDWPDASQVGDEPVPQLHILRIQCLQAVMCLVESLIGLDKQRTMAK